jgi:hypothetical protein
MTVREYIAELQKLDQDKNLWLIYDDGIFWDADVPSIVDKGALYKLGEDADGKVEVGDYAIFAG